MTSTAVTTAAAVCTMSAACHQFKEMPKAEKDATKHQAEATKHQAEKDATKHQAEATKHQAEEDATSEATKHQIEEGGNLSGFDFANRRVIDLRNEWYLAASVYRGTPP